MARQTSGTQTVRRFLRPKEAAEYLGIGLSSFWRLARTDDTFPPLIKLSDRVTVAEIAALDVWANHKGAVAEMAQ